MWFYEIPCVILLRSSSGVMNSIVYIGGYILATVIKISLMFVILITVPAAGPNITQFSPILRTSTSDVDVTFDSLPQDLRNGIINNYTVHYWSLEADDITRVRSGVTGPILRQTVRVTGLDISSVYQFSVQAFTSIGGGPLGENATVRTPTGSEFSRCVCLYAESSQQLAKYML